MPTETATPPSPFISTPAPGKPVVIAQTLPAHPPVGLLRKLAGFLWWLVTGFGLLTTLIQRKAPAPRPRKSSSTASTVPSSCGP